MDKIERGLTLKVNLSSLYVAKTATSCPLRPVFLSLVSFISPLIIICTLTSWFSAGFPLANVTSTYKTNSTATNTPIKKENENSLLNFGELFFVYRLLRVHTDKKQLQKYCKHSQKDKLTTVLDDKGIIYVYYGTFS